MATSFIGGIHDYHYEVASNRISNHSVWNKFGYNNDIDTTTDPEIVASFGGSFTPLTTAYTLDIVSDSTNDADSGTGAHGVVVYGVDSNWAHVVEVVLLDGTNTVTTTNSYYGVNRVALFRAGSLLKNEGTITITATTEGSTQAEIPAGEGTTEQCIFHVGANRQFHTDFLMLNVNKISGGGSPLVTIKAWVFSNVSNAQYEVFQYVIDTSVDNQLVLNPTQPFVIGEKSCLYFTAETNTNNTIVSIRFSGILRPL